ncbi:MAG: DUF1295 domain-containing protein [Pseudomonadota bacterium]
MDPITIYFLALALSLVVFVALWPISVAMTDVSIVDAWWGPGFFGAALLVWYVVGTPTDPRSLIVLALVGVWSLRLGFVLMRRRVRHGAEDSRYVTIRKSWGASFWWKSFFIVFLLQGFLQWIVGLTALSSLTASASPLGILAVVGVLLAIIGFTIEVISDAQLDRFKLTADSGTLYTGGLRQHVRFPSYCGEILFWWGMWLIALEAGQWWSVLSPVVLTFLLVKVSGAGITGAGLKHSKPEWRDYASRTPAFIPNFRTPQQSPAE